MCLFQHAILFQHYRTDFQNLRSKNKTILYYTTENILFYLSTKQGNLRDWKRSPKSLTDSETS